VDADNLQEAEAVGILQHARMKLADWLQHVDDPASSRVGRFVVPRFEYAEHRGPYVALKSLGFASSTVN
jgi:hypothetical protein